MINMLSHNTLIGSAFALLTVFSSGFAFAKDAERTINLQEDVASAELVKISIPAGEVRITGTTGNSVTAEITAQCQSKKDKEDCTKLLNELGWSKKTGATLELGVAPSGITKYDDINIKVKIGVPKDKKLEVSLHAGDLHIEGTSACLAADVNAGEISINLKESQLASAELKAKVGDVKLVTSKGATEGERSLLVGASLEWKGAGACHTKANVLAGEARLTLN